MADPFKMTRTDGTRVVRINHPSWKTEFINLYVALKEDPWILLLFPMFFASNYYYTWCQCSSYQLPMLCSRLRLIWNGTVFNDYNGAIFTIRARGLNNFAFWTTEIFGSLFMGHVILDQKRYRRRARAFIGWALVISMVFVVHIWAYFYQK